MILSAGSRLGPYEILAPLGAGGMGEVYRARDPRLNRDVAIKVSNEQFSDRFRREARAIAALNHPNVCSVFDVGPNYLVMELIEGPTLADRIAEGPIPLDEALPIARHIADALEAAHARGIVHRDLKPGNVKITAEGAVKVLDFGLAKVPEEAHTVTADSPTILSAPTRAGIILGTAAYMSPEQARGKAVDRRADIWAFGVVLYEMVTGKRLFQGDDLTETLASVIKDTPDMSAAPPQVQRLLRKCLEKDPNKRLRDISSVELLLEPESPVSTSSPGVPVPSTAARPSRRTVPWPVTLAVIAFGLIWTGWALRENMGGSAERATASANLLMNLSPAEMLGPSATGNRPPFTAFAISPDGSTIVFGGRRGDTTLLYRRSLADPAATPIAGTEHAYYPFFSPDGKWIGFGTAGKLKKVALAGGLPVDLGAFTGQNVWGANWGPNGSIVFSTFTALWTVPDSGGTPQKLLDASAWEPAFLPDGKHVIFTQNPGPGWDGAHIEVMDLGDKSQKTLIANAADARYLPPGYLIFMRNAALMAAPFDASRVRLSGSPLPMIPEVMQSINNDSLNNETGMGQFAVSGSGTLLYADGGISPTPSTHLLRVDRIGRQTEIAPVRGALVEERVSRDGRRLIGTVKLNGSREADIWSWELPSGVSTRLTSTGDSEDPTLSPDGRTMFFARTAEERGIYVSPIDRPQSARLVLAGKTLAVPAAVSPDGKMLAYFQIIGLSSELFVRPVDGASAASRKLIDSSYNIYDADFSPDGRWIAYGSNESGAYEVYVQPFPGPGERHRISTDGGLNPVWARNGRELFFLRAPDQIEVMAAGIAADGSRTGEPKVLFSGPYYPPTSPARSYDVTPDGQFIMTRSDPYPDQRVTQLHVILGWGEELKRRLK